jgi:hypothetical protein
MRYGAELPFGGDLAPAAAPLRRTLIALGIAAGKPSLPHFRMPTIFW